MKDRNDLAAAIVKMFVVLTCLGIGVYDTYLRWNAYERIANIELP